MTDELLKSPGAKLKLYRTAPSWDGVRTAAIGDFTCRDPGSGEELLRKACSILQSEGFAAVLGPMNGTTWKTYRLVTASDGSRPFLMEPTSGSGDLDAFIGSGFSEISQYFSARVALADIPAAPEPKDGLTLHVWDGTDPETHFSQVHELSCRAFARNLFYTPIDRDAFLAQYMPFVPILRPDLLIFARTAQGDLAGFLFGIPNYGEGQNPGTVILKTYASLVPGAGAAMAAQFHDTARRLGFTTAIHALIHDDNLSAERSRRNGATVFRRYALMGRRLDG